MVNKKENPKKLYRRVYYRNYFRKIENKEKNKENMRKGYWIKKIISLEPKYQEEIYLLKQKNSDYLKELYLKIASE
jgi:hypothetical protein